MAMTREEEERQRVARARENVEKWQEQFGQFSGAVRVSYSDGPVVTRTFGDETVAKKVIKHTPIGGPLPGPVMPYFVEASPPVVPPLPTRRPRHRWLAWLFNLISTEA